jgi:hypothetical protein
MSCKHAEMRSIVIYLHQKDPGDLHRVALSIRCEECGMPFRFTDGDEAICFNDERTELSAWIVEAPPSKVQ